MPKNGNQIICDLSIFTDEDREQHMQLGQEIFAKVCEVQETDSGYALRLPDEDGIILKLAAFINNDRRCCQFIHFDLTVKSYSKGIWLTMKGDSDEAKATIQGELMGLVSDSVSNTQ
ncbi:MAG: hypothetical protein AAFR81_19385 [Chloroflexota bacterium]